jgi:UDP-glucose 4-epimerase
VIWCATNINPLISNKNSDANRIELSYWSSFLGAYSQLKSSGFSPRIIFLSSGGCVYPDAPPPFKEELEGLPTNTYGGVKKEMERLALETIPNLAILRLSNVYGPGQPTGVGQGVIAEWIYKVLRGLPIEVYGDLNLFRDFIFVEDVAEAISLSLDPIEIRTVNIGSGEGISLNLLLEVIADASGVDPLIKLLPSRKVDRLGYWLDISKAQLNLGWNPKTTLLEGVRRVVEFEKRILL